MKKQKPRKLFLFRVIGSDRCGAVRARSVEEAADILVEHIGKPVELYRTPERFTLFVPPWS